MLGTLLGVAIIVGVAVYCSRQSDSNRPPKNSVNWTTNPTLQSVPPPAVAAASAPTTPIPPADAPPGPVPVVEMSGMHK